jgi:hypothetical protein
MSAIVESSIDINRLTDGKVLNLAGHDRGLAARDRFELARLDLESEAVAVHFPEGFRQLSSSFFQGMFADSVRKFGSVKLFFEHYRFDAPAHIRTKLADYAEQILNRRDY